MISERMLRKWRKEALLARQSLSNAAIVDDNWTELSLSRYEAVQLYNNIDKMTQELLDQYLLNK